MRLRRVAVCGFKTFAGRSEVSLEPGITAIVGPNGSGKSNLVDAIRWALGETNARELRGARMDEVIYSGGNGRGRMGFAEVELILDNEDGRLPVDDVEVSVSRRVVRHGDSDFRLNGDRVRLRDLERVLGTTGLTQSGYAVVAQNDIDAIIEATPAQRRALVEQAAGVRALRAACEDALGRVGQAEVTLRRFEDLLGETEPRLAELAEQAELALQQRELSDQLSRLRGSLAREAWRGARAQVRQATRRLDAAERRLEAAATAEAAFAERLERHRQRLETQRAGHLEATRLLEDARLRAERAAGDERRGVDRLRAGVLSRASAAAELRAAAVEVAERTVELGRLRSAVADEAGQGGGLQRRIDACRSAEQAAAAGLLAADGVLAGYEVALRAAEEERVEADAAVRRSVTQLRLLNDVAQPLQERVDSTAAGLADLEERARAALAARDRADDAATAAQSARRDAADALVATRRHAADAQAALDAARETARTALARAASLRGQVEGALGGRGAIADAVAAGEIDARRLVDSFAVLDDADAAAVEAALEAHLGAWIVADVDEAATHLDARSVREELISEGAEAPPPPSTPAGARAALSAIRALPGAEGALALCLAGAWLVDDRPVGRAVVARTGGRAVLPDGTVITANGLRGGGRPGRTLQLAASEHEAAAAAAAAIAQERAAEAARGALTERAATLEAAERAAADEVQAAHIEAARTAVEATAAAAAVVSERQRLDAARAELAARDRERGLLEGDEGSAAERLAAAQARLEGARAEAAAARDAAARSRAAADDAVEDLREAEAEAERATMAGADRRRRLEAAGDALEVVAARRSDAELRVLTAELDVIAALARGRASRVAVARGEAEVAGAMAAIAVAAPGLAESERAIAALDSERAEVAVVLARAQDERTAAHAEVAAAAARVAELALAVRDDEQDEGPEPEAGDADRAEREIVRLERRIGALGPVNALAPEQHDELAARVAVLRAGRDDLGRACADIRSMARRLTAAIDQRFEAVFGAVSIHFHELFAELFPGGRATLRREEPPAGDADDGADGSGARLPGVEILAQPPGKRLQPLSLFSGGERALTALAVIFALQQVNPSPFYVFDEVDAPLDDSNVLRFTRLLKRLAQAQQFIVVTHNHITMAAADALHGVTSDGDGVSSVISVRFDAELGMAVPEGNVVGLRQSTIRAAV
ncbi:MAG TPA: chromosome segregation protein SMC [Candidatus Dormibacteraeota bacterium]|nr:chromosome segregation protein SMC [Candidatus Dormibacteraeota bacterium]